VRPLPVCADKALPFGGDESARDEISVLIAGMPGALRREHHIVKKPKLITRGIYFNLIIAQLHKLKLSFCLFNMSCLKI
jgi:hypothetical protein